VAEQKHSVPENECSKSSSTNSADTLGKQQHGQPQVGNAVVSKAASAGSLYGMLAEIGMEMYVPAGL